METHGVFQNPPKVLVRPRGRPEFVILTLIVRINCTTKVFPPPLTGWVRAPLAVLWDVYINYNIEVPGYIQSFAYFLLHSFS